MKKLFVVLFVFVFAGMMMAQNTATHTQYGDNNDGLITQTDGGHTATIIQGSTSNLINDANALVNQSANSNTAYIEQGTNKNANEADAQIYQSVGDNNSASIKQVLYTHGHGDKWGTPQQNTSRIDQIGANNIADVVSEARRGKSSVYQEGDGNTGNILQDTERDFEAYITQFGDDNFADVHQFGDANGDAVVYQDGMENTVNLYQTGAGDANIYQEGDYNTVMGLGTDVTANTLGGSTLDVDQIGNLNTAHVYQAHGAAATVYQNGNTNTSIVDQQ